MNDAFKMEDFQSLSDFPGLWCAIRKLGMNDKHDKTKSSEANKYIFTVGKTGNRRIL